MVAIKDVEMLSCCGKCPMTYKDEVDYRICAIIGKNIDYGNANEIHPDCPLVEIVTCKDCKHSRTCVIEEETYRYCIKGGTIQGVVSDGYFCGDGERRE